MRWPTHPMIQSETKTRLQSSNPSIHPGTIILFRIYLFSSNLQSIQYRLVKQKMPYIILSSGVASPLYNLFYFMQIKKNLKLFPFEVSVHRIDKFQSSLKATEFLIIQLLRSEEKSCVICSCSFVA